MSTLPGGTTTNQSDSSETIDVETVDGIVDDTQQNTNGDNDSSNETIDVETINDPSTASEDDATSADQVDTETQTRDEAADKAYDDAYHETYEKAVQEAKAKNNGVLTEEDKRNAIIAAGIAASEASDKVESIQTEFEYLHATIDQVVVFCVRSFLGRLVTACHSSSLCATTNLANHANDRSFRTILATAYSRDS